MNQQPAGRPGATDMRATPSRSEPVREAIRQRKRKGSGMSDRFWVDPAKIPPGTSYEWKRETLKGQEDPAYNVEMREQGWEPVEVSRHPEFMPSGYTGVIRRDGMVLMERPQELTDEARAEEKAAAFGAVRSKEEQLQGEPSGHFKRTSMKLTKSYDMPLEEGIEVP